jgi:hypothetical protein
MARLPATSDPSNNRIGIATADDTAKLGQGEITPPSRGYGEIEALVIQLRQCLSRIHHLQHKSAVLALREPNQCQPDPGQYGYHTL